MMFLRLRVLKQGCDPTFVGPLAVFPIVSYFDMVIRSLAIESKEIELKRENEASALARNVQTSQSQQQRKKPRHYTFSIPLPFNQLPLYLKRSSFRGFHQLGGTVGILCLTLGLAVIVVIRTILFVSVLTLLNKLIQWG